MGNMLLVIGLVTLCATSGLAQTAATSPTPKGATTIAKSDGELVNGIFRSTNGGFSIDISALPDDVTDHATEKAKRKGIDAGKVLSWEVERKILYTICYLPPVTDDGEPMKQTTLERLKTLGRESLTQDASTIESETSIKSGGYDGVEMRSVAAFGIHRIDRYYFVGDVGYILTAVYADVAYEKQALNVMDSFKFLKAKKAF